MNRVVLQINRTTEKASDNNAHANGDNNAHVDANTVATLERAANKALNHHRVVDAIGVTASETTGLVFGIHLTLLSKTEMQTLNNTYRQINKPTDVLTFPLFDQQEVGTEIRQIAQLHHADTDNHATTPLPLGDIAICTAIAYQQSQNLGHSYTKELAFLLIHGTLHLLGFDHIHDHHSEIMLPLQNEILVSLGIT